MIRYWWVNQNQTYRHETDGGFLWSPQRNRGGARNPFYDTMEQVRAGDLIFSFCDTKIRAVGVAQGAAQAAVKPNFGAVGDQWDNEGWFVPVEFTPTTTPVQPKSFIAELTPYLSPKYAPLQPNGNGNQGVYLPKSLQGLQASCSQNSGSAPRHLPLHLNPSSRHKTMQRKIRCAGETTLAQRISSSSRSRAAGRACFAPTCD